MWSKFSAVSGLQVICVRMHERLRACQVIRRIEVEERMRVLPRIECCETMGQGGRGPVQGPLASREGGRHGFERAGAPQAKQRFNAVPVACKANLPVQGEAGVQARDQTVRQKRRVARHRRQQIKALVARMAPYVFFGD